MAVRTLEEAREEDRQQAEAHRKVDAQQKLLDDMVTVDEKMRLLGPETKTEIRQATGMGGDRFGRAWVAMLEEKRIEGTEVKKDNGQKYSGWNLKEHPLEDSSS